MQDSNDKEMNLEELDMVSGGFAEDSLAVARVRGGLALELVTVDSLASAAPALAVSPIGPHLPPFKPIKPIKPFAPASGKSAKIVKARGDIQDSGF